MRNIAKCLMGELEKREIYMLQAVGKREVLKINRFSLVVFFRKKFSRAEGCAEEILFLCMEFILLFANKKGRYLRTTLNVYTTE